MNRARSRAPFSAPLPFLRRRHPLLAAMLRWPLLRRWLHPGDVTTLPRRPLGGTPRRSVA